MTPLRVLHVIGGDDTGGAMSYLLPLLGALRGQGCDAQLLCLGGGGLAQAAAGRGLLHTVIPMSHAWDVRALAPLRHHLSAGAAWQVIHTHGMRANLPVRMVLPSLRPRPLLFTTVHSDLALDYSSALKSTAYGLLDRGTRAGVDVFCCVSSDLARRLVARGVSAQRVHVVHPGIELDGMGLGTETGAPRTAFSAGDSAVPATARGHGATIGTVARLVPVKDLGLLLEAVALVARSIPEVRLKIVGDGPERAALERRAAEPDLAGRVDFFGKVVPAWPLLSRFDIYATSSESEGIPISVLEAMAAGLPVVATAVGGLPETVRDGVTGFLVKRRQDRRATITAFAGRLAELLTYSGMRARMGAAGRERVAMEFSSRAAAATMLDIYEKALAVQGSADPRATEVEAAAREAPATTRAGSPWPTAPVLGFRLDLVDLETAAEWAVKAARRQVGVVIAQAGGSAGGAEVPGGAGPLVPGRTAIAVSFNPELVMRAREDRVPAGIIRAADLCYADGVGAVWAARRGLGAGGGSDSAVARVAGIDLAQRVLELAAEAGLSVYFLGAKPGVADEAAKRQAAQIPGLRIAGVRDGYLSAAEEASVVAGVRESGADILLVAMGAPRQEILLFDHRDEWGAGAALGIGGSFDVWAGTTTRAPGWVRKAGVEWLYRLAREPKRLNRQMVLPRYVYRVMRGGGA